MLFHPYQTLVTIRYATHSAHDTEDIVVNSVEFHLERRRSGKGHVKGSVINT